MGCITNDELVSSWTYYGKKTTNNNDKAKEKGISAGLTLRCGTGNHLLLIVVVMVKHFSSHLLLMIYQRIIVV